MRDVIETDLLTVSEAADLVGVHPDTIKRWTRAGKLPVIQVVDRGWKRYRREDVERLLNPENAA